MKDDFILEKEHIEKSIYKFDKITEFESMWHLESRDNKCPYCNKKMLIYYNDKHEMFIEVCKDIKCGFYRAQKHLEPYEINIDLNMVILPGYND